LVLDACLRIVAVVEQPRIAAEDAAVQPLDVLVGIDSEVGHQEPAKVFIYRQRLDLPAAAIQRDHLMCAQSLSPRFGLYPRVDILQDVEMTAAPQVRHVA